MYKKPGKTLVLLIGVQVEVKKLFKGFAFSQKLETNLPLIRRIGIAGFFYCKRFKINLYISGAALGSISFSKNVDIFKFQYFLRTIISFGICQKRKYQLYLLRVFFWLLKKYDYCMKRNY